ncbi:hypothetical protein CsSME_00041163 [Camellia sinensis var. sinensis]
MSHGNSFSKNEVKLASPDHALAAFIFSTVEAGLKRWNSKTCKDICSMYCVKDCGFVVGCCNNSLLGYWNITALHKRAANFEGHIQFSKGTAETMKKMLETSFPGIDVVLANYPPPLPKRVLSKLVPAVQMGVIGIIMAGEQIFPILGFMVPPPSYYYSLLANRFGSIATTWLLGNDLQNFLQSTGAFEVYLNDEPVFSKLKKGRFPGEIEWKDLINKKLANPQVLHNYQVMWS